MIDQEEPKQKGRANDIDKLVSRRLKEKRLALGLTQKGIAQAVSVSIQQVQKYEKNVDRISSGTLYAIAKFLKVPITYFFKALQSKEETQLKKE